jgi:hypothetical protein
VGVLGPVHRRPGTPPPPRRERPRRVSKAPGEPGRLHERAAPYTWPRRPHPAVGPRRVDGSGCLAVADERSTETGQQAAPGDLHVGHRGRRLGRYSMDGKPGSSGSPRSRPAATLPQACTALDCSVVLSAWESAPFRPIRYLTSDATRPRVTVRHPCSPGLTGHGGRQAYGQFAGIGASRDGCCCCCQRACA